MAEIDDTQSTMPHQPEIPSAPGDSAGGGLMAGGEIPTVGVTLASALGMAAGRSDMRWCEHNAGAEAPAGGAAGVVRRASKVAEKRGV